MVLCFESGKSVNIYVRYGDDQRWIVFEEVAYFVVRDPTSWRFAGYESLDDLVSVWVVKLFGLRSRSRKKDIARPRASLTAYLNNPFAALTDLGS
jgi:hypothetical protein